jgi:hypothetical protein
LILVADCTHFQEFHACLEYTIADNLRIGGVATQLQPPRGNSLAKFSRASRVLLEQNYSETLSRLHDQHLGTAAFDSDIHYPQLLILQKLREVTDEGRVAAAAHSEVLSLVAKYLVSN